MTCFLYLFKITDSQFGMSNGIAHFFHVHLVKQFIFERLSRDINGKTFFDDISSANKLLIF